MNEYVSSSLETHLFFGRIMKEHSLFLLASFPARETGLMQRADRFRREFEEGLAKCVRLAGGLVGNAVLSSGEIVTEYTLTAECQTQKLTGITIDTGITQAEEQLRCGCPAAICRETVRDVRSLNRQMLQSLDGLIAFKEEVLQKVLSCSLYTANYPLLIEHILREAKLYRRILTQLEEKERIPASDLRETEIFWNRIMLEHATFIRGLLDPTENELIEAANGFAGDYHRLLDKARDRDCRAMDALTARTLRTTKEYRQFKAAGTKGITGCQIRSVILPLLADHVLREANHYLRLLEHAPQA